MRRRAHRSARPARIAACGACVAIAFGFAFAAHPAKALDASDDEQEIHAEETLPSYAGTELPVE
jgi:hypothetical protein